MALPNLRLSSAVLGGLARPGFSDSVGRAIGAAVSAPEERRKKGMLTDLLAPALDPTASSSDVTKAAIKAAEIDPELAIRISGIAQNRLTAEQNRRTASQEQQRKRAERTQQRTTEALAEGTKLIQLERAKAIATNRGEDGTDDSKENFRSLLASELITPDQYIELALKPKSKNTSIQTKNIVVDGEEKTVAVAIDSSGQEVGRTVLGNAPTKPKAESDTGSELKNPVEEELIKRTREGESAVREFNNSSRLQQQLLDGSIELTPGVIGGIRTRAYEIAGIQDEEESVKRDFIRARNTEIINSLPPGIASDTDIRVFSAGFPSDNANQETVLRFLAAQKRIFSAAADMGTLYDDHITQQINDGVKSPTTAGFYSKKMAYGNAVAILETNIQRDPDNAQKYLGDFQKAFGFVPLFYR